MALANALDAKHFGALIKGLSARCFFGDDITLGFLAEQVYGGEDDAAEAQLVEFEKLLLQAARENWDPSAFESHVGERDLSAEQSAQGPGCLPHWRRRWERTLGRCLAPLARAWHPPGPDR